jgi:mRNA interferase RelE/StbE
MQVLFNRSFLKNLVKLPIDIKTKIENFVFEELPKYNSIHQVGNIEKMQGYDGYYKVRFGLYRVGLKLENNNTVIIQTVMHRKEIYRYFP